MTKKDKMTDKQKQTIEAPVRAAKHAVMRRLRMMDFDDLYLLSHLLDGQTVAATARILGLTQPAVTQRVRKIERVFGLAILRKAGRHVELTPAGMSIGKRAGDALRLIEHVDELWQESRLTLATSAQIALERLWPIVAQRDEQPFHIETAAESELIAMFERGDVDAIITAGDLPEGPYTVFSAGDDDYLAVAASELLARHADEDTLAMIKAMPAIDLDRSQPLLGRLDAKLLSRLPLTSVRYLGAPELVLQAVLAGQGWSVLSRNKIAPLVGAGKLQVIEPNLKITADRLQLIVRKDHRQRDLLASIAEELVKND